jgi:hypothetical protein
MKLLVNITVVTAITFVVPAFAQTTGQGAPILRAGSNSQNSSNTRGVAVPGGGAINSNTPAQKGTSENDNSGVTNRQGSADSNSNLTLAPSPGSQTAGTSASGPASGTAVTSGPADGAINNNVQ